MPGHRRELVPSSSGTERYLVKTRISLFIIGLVFAIGSTTAWAAIDRNTLLGTWEGNLEIHFHSNVKAMAVEVSFQKDGTFIIKQVTSGKADQAKFKIEGDRLLITDGKGKDSYIRDIKLTKDEQGMFDKSVEAVKGLMEACKGIDDSLA